jgi:type IV pilus assembly protein PilX
MNLPIHGTTRSRQSGAALIFLLLMLLLVSVMGLSSVKLSTTNEKIVGNVRDRHTAFQAAEAAVQACLEQLHAGTYPAAAILTPSDASQPPHWEVASNWAEGAAASQSVALADAGLAAPPRCLAESLGSGSFRVTGRAVGGSPDTEVVLQATYSTE